MQKTVVKSLGIFMLVFFVLSMTGAAANCNSANNKMDAKDDVFTLDPCKATRCFNILSNDIGAGRTVTSPTGIIIPTYIITTDQGNKLSLKSNGVLCYTKIVSCKSSDIFTYTAKNKCGKTDTATVTVNFKCTGCSKCSSGKCTKCTGCPKSTCPSCSSCTSCT